MPLNGIKGLLIQTSLRGVCDSKECLKFRLHFPAYVEMFLMGMPSKEVVGQTIKCDDSKESYGAELS